MVVASRAHARARDRGGVLLGRGTAPPGQCYLVRGFCDVIPPSPWLVFVLVGWGLPVFAGVSESGAGGFVASGLVA